MLVFGHRIEGWFKKESNGFFPLSLIFSDPLSGFVVLFLTLENAQTAVCTTSKRTHAPSNASNTGKENVYLFRSSNNKNRRKWREKKIKVTTLIEKIAWSCDFVYSFRLHTVDTPSHDSMTRRIYIYTFFRLYFSNVSSHFILSLAFFSPLDSLFCYSSSLPIFCLVDFDEPATIYCCICWMCRLPWYYTGTNVGVIHSGKKVLYEQSKCASD